MDRAYLRFVASGTADRIVDALSEQQFISPHRSIEQAIAAAGVKVGFCAEAARRAVETLGVQADLAIGRLRRTELMQLARAIHRNWRQSVGQVSGAS